MIPMGLHDHGGANEAAQAYLLAVKPPMTKFLAGASRETMALARSLGCDVILRLYEPDQNESEAGHRAYLDRVIQAAVDHPDANWVEVSYNEAEQTDPDSLRRKARWDVDGMVAMEAIGRKGVIGSFGVGWPKVEEIGAYQAAIRYAHAHGHRLGLHEYGGGDQGMRFDPSWYALRHDRFFIETERLGLPKLDFYVTEAGIDHLDRAEKSTPGYKLSRANYPDDLQWFAGQLPHNCKGWCDFGWAGGQMWREYDLSTDPGTLAEVQRRMTAPARPAPVPKPQEPGMATHVVRKGDTLFKLGSLYGVPWISIADANGMRSPYTLKVGAVIKLPRAVGQVTPGTPVNQGYEIVNGPYTENRWPRPQGNKISWIIVHSPVGATVEQTLKYLRKNSAGVSYHELVADKVYVLAGKDEWVGHAGSSSSRIPGTNVTNRAVNYRTIGVSLFDGPRVTPAVAELGAWRVADLIKQLRLPDAGVVLGHGEIDPSRRSDPVGVNMEAFRRRVAELL